MKLDDKINYMIKNFERNISLYVTDDYNNEIKINEDIIVESASCIKIFILIEYYNQILKKQKNRNDILSYDNKYDYVTNGSEIIQYMDNLELTSKNMAILMTIVSDNIATNKMIEYLGLDKINDTIKKWDL